MVLDGIQTFATVARDDDANCQILLDMLSMAQYIALQHESTHTQNIDKMQGLSKK